MKIHIVSLGCARNLVDSEGLAGLLEKAGHRTAGRLEDAECLVINTCSFIRPAEEESVAIILEAAELKRKGKLRRLYVAGCLPQKRRGEREDLLKLLPEVDGFLGPGDLPRLPELMEAQSVRPEQAVHPSTKAQDERRVEGPDQFRKGVEMIARRLEGFLKSYGIVPMEVVGKPFDPALHEAVAHEVTEEAPESTVMAELRRGYLMNGRVLRTAVVKVAARSSQAQKEA